MLQRLLKEPLTQKPAEALRNAVDVCARAIVERSVRPLALTRRIRLFAGSDGGPDHRAILASLIETAKLNNVDPQGYIASVITRVVEGHPRSQIDQLLPWSHQAKPAATI